MAEAGRWAAAHIETAAEPFFSFSYGGRPSSELLGSWNWRRCCRRLDEARTEHMLVGTDRKTGLLLTCIGVEYRDFPTVEWTLYFQNTGGKDAPILADVQALDSVFRRGDGGEFVLHHLVGDRCSMESFTPQRTVLGPNVDKRLAPCGGRPSDGQWPYYNLERPREKQGMLLAIGWPGQWESRFIRDGKQGLRVLAGQQLTHLTLHPGERIRTPLIVLQFYKGDWLHGQNVWRRWMFAHNFPKDHDKPLAARMSAASVQFCDFHCTEAKDLDFIDRITKQRLPFDYWWMDAGWYEMDGTDWWNVGTWEVDRKRFPQGIRAISDRCHANGMQVIVWFEVERAHRGTWMAKNHPDWVFAGKDDGLVRMDKPDAVRWLTDHIDKMISREGVDLYRSDFNLAPLHYWRENDAADRQGITENHYIEGYLAYWDELRRRHPGMLIDSCASGGRRDDLETMRRAVPLLRTDFEGNPEGNQCHTYGFALWLPYFDAVHNWQDNVYRFRSSIAPFLTCNWNVCDKQFPFERAKQLVRQWRSVADYYWGDFYPLGQHSTDDDVWMAWQFDRPDWGGGLIQAFRRPNSPYVAARYRLHALDPNAVYVLTDLDSPGTVEKIGRELMQPGLLISIEAQPGALLLVYKKKGDGAAARLSRERWEP